MFFEYFLLSLLVIGTMFYILYLIFHLCTSLFFSYTTFRRKQALVKFGQKRTIDNDGHFDTRVMVFAPDLRTPVIQPPKTMQRGAYYGYDVNEIDYRSNAG
jgi:hypothetical protein